MPIPPFNTYLGAEVLRKENGEAEVVLDLRPHHLNRRGVAHGGVICALLDSALGAAVIAAIPAEWWCATTSLTTQFLDGVGEGRLVGSGRVLRRGRSMAFATGEVRDARGRLIATASGSWHLWPYRPDRPRAVAGPYLRVAGSGETLRVGKILAVGRNYAAHNREMGAAESAPPLIFLKPPSAIVHDGGEIVMPDAPGELHHEVELVVAIGRRGRAIGVADALDHVLGFAVGLDMTLRDVQGEAKRRGEPWSLAKGFDGSAPVSEVVPRERVGDGSGLSIELSVNGEPRQQGNTAQMSRSVPELVAFASRWITLERGDLLFTGTPSGVGAVGPGDLLEARIDRVGRLAVRIVAAGD